MIDGVKLTHLDIIEVEGGDVLHALKKTDSGYIHFGEAYFSKVKLKAIKAWKRHKKMTLNLICPVGEVKFVLVDDSEEEITFEEYVLSNENYKRLTVPPGVWFGFQGLSINHSLVLNIADIIHDPEEVERKELKEILYRWEK